MRGRVHRRDSHAVLLDGECGIGGGCVCGSRAGPTHTLTALSRGFAPYVLCHMRLKQKCPGRLESSRGRLSDELYGGLSTVRLLRKVATEGRDRVNVFRRADRGVQGVK